jgi:putative hydroxymethylpyrimidine transport system permease protein
MNNVNQLSTVARSEKISFHLLRVIISASVMIGLWQAIVVIFDMPAFILPAPFDVFERLIQRQDVLLKHTWVTAQEILLGLLLDLSMGLIFALQMLMFNPLKRWLLPILIASQAIPVFAIAPVLMLWLGYLMLQANARMMIDEMFAALFILSALAVSLYFAADEALITQVTSRCRIQSLIFCFSSRKRTQRNDESFPSSLTMKWERI